MVHNLLIFQLMSSSSLNSTSNPSTSNLIHNSIRRKSHHHLVFSRSSRWCPQNKHGLTPRNPISRRNVVERCNTIPTGILRESRNEVLPFLLSTHIGMRGRNRNDSTSVGRRGNRENSTRSLSALHSLSELSAFIVKVDNSCHSSFVGSVSVFLVVVFGFWFLVSGFWLRFELGQGLGMGKKR